MKQTQPAGWATVPMQIVGPIKILGPEIEDSVMVPLATYETPLWPSVARGAKLSVACGGIRAVIADDRMTRSILLEAPTAIGAVEAAGRLRERFTEMAMAAQSTSRFATLIDFHTQIAGNLLFVRLEYRTGDAAGHNMTTKASEAVMNWILKEFGYLKYVSISGNFCTDKKASAVNGILGRGKNVIAEITVPRATCEKLLKTTPEKIVNLNIKKNLIGTMLAGGLRSANAHYANMLLAFYLATGQDAANIVEGSQGFVHAEIKDDPSTGLGAGALYFSTTVPHVIVGTAGSGKDLGFVRKNMELMGCVNSGAPGQNARRLAVIAAATVLCGEISLLAAQTNPGELMRAHIKMERK